MMQLREKLVRSLASCSAEFLERTPFYLRGDLRDLFNIGRLAALSPIGNRRKIRAIRLQHELAGWRRRKRIADVLTVLECQNSGEAYDRAHRHDAPHGRRIIRKAMELPAHPTDKWLHRRERIL